MNSYTRDKLIDWNKLNDTYIRESGMESKPFLSKEFAWGNWSKHGFTESELVQVLRYLRKEIKSGNRKPASMLFRNLIEYPENFEQELSLSKEALLRNSRAETPRQSILAATGRTEQQDKPPRPVSDVLEADRAFKAFQAWKVEQGL